MVIVFWFVWVVVCCVGVDCFGCVVFYVWYDVDVLGVCVVFVVDCVGIGVFFCCCFSE